MHGATLVDDLVGGAFDFDGKESWVEVAPSSSLRMRSLTVAAWVKLTSPKTFRVGGKNDDFFRSYPFNFSSPPVDKYWGFVFGKYKDDFKFCVGQGPAGEKFAAIREKPQVGKWAFIVGVAANGKIKAYLDGQLKHSVEDKRPFDDRERPFFIGRTGLADWEAFWPGRIDEVALWPRGLSDKEVRELHVYSSQGKSYCNAIGKMRTETIRKVAYENLLGMKFVKLPAGEFMMGSSEEEVKSLVAAHRVNEDWIRALETPKHRVRITRDFYMGIHEVTQAQYRKAMGQSPARHRGDNRPAELDDWRPAGVFCRWLNTNDNQRPDGYEYRLPTEAEWEYACRAGSTTPFHFSQDTAQAGDYAWFSGNSPRVTHDVGLKKPNAWGLYDMYGNVWEWCEDWFCEDYYKGSPETDPLNRRPGPNHVGRGASWGDPAFWCRSTLRIGPPRLANLRGSPRRLTKAVGEATAWGSARTGTHIYAGWPYNWPGFGGNISRTVHW